MANFAEQMRRLFEEYTAEMGGQPVSLDQVAEWAVSMGRYQPEPRSVLKLCREALANSLREEKRIDQEGREYRAKHSVRESIGGTQLTLWGDIDTAPRVFMEKSFAQRRKGIAADCYQIKQDVDHFNDERAGSNPWQIVLDFSEDVAEMEAAKRHIADKDVA